MRFFSIPILFTQIHQNIAFPVIFRAGFLAAVNILALSVTYGDTSPKGRGLGKEMKFAWTAKGSPFGRAAEQSEAERASPLPTQKSTASLTENGAFFCPDVENPVQF